MGRVYESELPLGFNRKVNQRIYTTLTTKCCAGKTKLTELLTMRARAAKMNLCQHVGLVWRSALNVPKMTRVIQKCYYSPKGLTFAGEFSGGISIEI